jgi:uncharacterized membrane protein YccC
VEKASKYLALAFLGLAVLALAVGLLGDHWFLLFAAVWLALAVFYGHNYRHPKPMTGRADSVWTAHRKWRSSSK